MTKSNKENFDDLIEESIFIERILWSISIGIILSVIYLVLAY